VQMDHLAYFELVGKLIGVALSGRSHLPANFSVPLLKELIRIPLAVDDLCGIDMQLHRNVVEYHRGLTESELADQGLTFTYQEEHFGNVEVVDLLGCGGEDATVETHRDLEHYLKTLTHYMMVRRVDKQLSQLRQGLYSLVPDALLAAAGKCFSAKEFGVLISGIDVFDDGMVDDLQQYTRYEGYEASDDAIISFWRMVRHRFNQKQRTAFLTFAHGCPRIPARGFQHLAGYNGAVHQFTIVWVESPAEGSELREAYPRAQTCFNKLFLPAYRTEAEMETRLCAVIESTTAGFDEAAVAA